MIIFKIFRRVFFYCSLAVIFAAHAARYTLRRILGDRKSPHGVRVILVREAAVVLVRHWYAPGVWTLPGGGINSDESLEIAAKREVFEETGLTVNSFGGEVGTYQGRMGSQDTATVLYSEDFSGHLTFAPSIEIMERGFFDFNHLPKTLSPANRKRIEEYKMGVRNKKGMWH